MGGKEVRDLQRSLRSAASSLRPLKAMRGQACWAMTVARNQPKWILCASNPPCFQICQAAAPMKPYARVQAIVKKGAGGVHLGFFRALYLQNIQNSLIVSPVWHQSHDTEDIWESVYARQSVLHGACWNLFQVGVVWCSRCSSGSCTWGFYWHKAVLLYQGRQCQYQS